MDFFLTEDRSRKKRIAGPEIRARDFEEAKAIASNLDDEIVVIGKKVSAVRISFN